MDTVAFLLIIIGLALYFLLRNKDTKAATFGIWVFGTGCGLLAGALWAVQIINNVMP